MKFAYALSVVCLSAPIIIASCAILVYSSSFKHKHIGETPQLLYNTSGTWAIWVACCKSLVLILKLHCGWTCADPYLCALGLIRAHLLDLRRLRRCKNQWHGLRDQIRAFSQPRRAEKQQSVGYNKNLCKFVRVQGLSFRVQVYYGLGKRIQGFEKKA